MPSLCDCEVTYDQPIDYGRPLLNTTAVHAKHLLICTNQDINYPSTLACSLSWPSKVDLQPDSLAGELANIKRPSSVNDYQSPFDPMYPIMITNVDLVNEVVNVVHNRKQGQERNKNKENEKFKSETTRSPELFYSAYLYPDNIYFPRLSTNPYRVQAFVKSYLVPFSARDQAARKSFPSIHLGEDADIRSHDSMSPNRRNLILICGHATRDSRCGKAAPILLKAFEEVLASKGLTGVIEVAICSHIGGHAYAGNIICFDNQGSSVWYGRVEPKHVEGIVQQTCLEKKIIKELYRGGIN
ncbi:hypothetical protein NADFUDRAFT_68413 [Nadsonia fulvescens var. elongata DSM 6958]|uniref:Altered inheritance of mitochondria protein 32 n=1 Tax=Nadsonia fulvescens var. elongata DSM 6958 TaxID=857566 RepID=A0A1E3PRP0_9ASCO|nr:hypothetical protein NADFUDRAFT_68413 [Nadsonia fulvescens var. elongata DSM 6958]